ncbi:6758_t:CDS:1 [Funneliformis caledonium]|uniref:Conserved oligomeric Golgi complex subunit 8 n=1 Tax=Funneliformis caledonium TaxID=1117310 RepID=A0A9N9CIS5_9GLOM|nr:6758_t:CDS:1 [Funneliformis caledonium]
MNVNLTEKEQFYTSTHSNTSGQEILLSLLTDSLPEKQHELVNKEWSKDYLDRLTSLSLESLKLEPTLVKDEESKIQKELAELSFREYKSCIHVNNCYTEINYSLDNLSLHLSTLMTVIPSLENSSNSFSQHTKQISLQRNKINTILEHNDNLLEILEIPQLMDTCVRNGLYSEAMDLSQHVARLVSKHSNIPLIRQIEQDVKQTMQSMLSKLISLLREPIKLPSCLKVIGYLRRMEAFDEAELRLVFLLSRDTYLQILIHSIDKEKKDPAQYLKKWIDIFREHFFDIVTQYRSIFAEDGGGLASTPIYSSFMIPQSPSSPWMTPSSLTDTTNDNPTGRHNLMATTVLADYTIHILNQLTSVLAEFTPLIIDIQSLSSILTQLMYCGMSLGRVGVDFRHLVTRYFEEGVERIIKKIISDGTQVFLDELKQAIKNINLPNTWMIVDKKSTNLIESSIRSSSFTPLVILLDYPPIAYLTNAYLTAFNSLRIVAPVSLYYTLGDYLSWNLLTISETLRNYGNLLVDNNHDTTVLQGFNATFARSFVPFITRCYVDGVYGGLLGGGDEAHLEVIDQAKILNILKEFLPVPISKSNKS